MYNNFKLPEGLLDGLTDEQLQDLLKEQGNEELRHTLEELSKKSMTKAINSKDYSQLTQKELDKLVDKEGGLVIEPTSSFVFKTLYNKGEKLFINICEHYIVDEPEEKELVELQDG